MQENLIPLHLLPLGRSGKVCSLTASDGARRRMMDLGFINNATVEALLRSPSGDPTAYQIRGAVIALRSEEADNILVELF
ncbi:MAG: FeoA family protein [Clostridia bacterium]|nr:FeoA family protein [Clostridia bacterium]